MAENENPAGTTEGTAQVSPAGTAPTTPAGSEAQTGSEIDWKAKYDSEHTERMANLEKVQEANRIIAEHQQQEADAARRGTPTTQPERRSYLSMLDPDAIRTYEYIAQNDPSEDNRRAARTVLAGVEGGLLAQEAQREAMLTRQLLAIPEGRRQAVIKEFDSNPRQYRDYNDAARALDAKSMPSLQQQLEETQRRLRELEAQQAGGVANSTHIPAVATGGGSGALPKHMDGQTLQTFFIPGHANYNPKRGDAIQAGIDAGTIQYSER